MSLVSLVRGRRGVSGFGYASTAEEVTRGLSLRGQNILITGVSSGLGAETARVLQLRGATILGAARTIEKAQEACRSIGPNAVPVACELAEPASVRACVEDIRARGVELDVIVCNAGIMALPQRELRHGQELQFLTNHIGHFGLVTGLLDRLRDRGRVVVLSSAAHQLTPNGGIQFEDLTLERNYTPWLAYGHSKLANLLFARALAGRLAGTQRTANSLHPGTIVTPLTRHMPSLTQTAASLASGLFFKTVGEGAATQCYVAAHPAASGISGEYFENCNVARPSRYGRDAALAERLWDVSERIWKALH
jgi:WW domain-containing oxidoreductase